MAPQSGRSAFPDTTAVPMADGGADDCTEKVSKASGTTGIYGMILPCRTFVQNREILRPLPCICGCTAFHCKDSFCHGFTVLYGAAVHISFFERIHGEKAP